MSQLNKTIWKQSGPVNVPAQSDPSAFVAAEKNGLSKSRDGRQVGEAEGVGGGGPHHLNPQVILRDTHPDPVLTRAASPPSHPPRLLSAPIKGEHVICLR